MKILYPLLLKYPDFKKDCLVEEEKDGKDGYTVQEKLLIIFSRPGRWPITEIIQHVDQARGFKIRACKNKVVVEIEKGLWFDGATFAIDYHTRLLFALCHDCGCWASQDTREPIYERIFDNLAFEIIRKQGGWWFNAWRVEVAVKKWNSMGD